MKIELLIDGVVEFTKQIDESPPVVVIPPVVDPPIIVPPVVPPPIPDGLKWVWDDRPVFNLEAGEERIYIINIDKPLTYLNLGISGLTMNTIGTFSWTFPDGRVFPQPGMRQGLMSILGMNGAGVLALRTTGQNKNFSEPYVPQGNHVLRISVPTGTNTGGDPFSGSFKVGIEVE